MAKDLFYGDADPVETQEWMEALESVLENEGPDRARYLLERLSEKAHASGVRLTNLNTPYINTIPPEDQPQYPGDPYLERQIRSLIRWNALAMVMRANLSDDELG
ncbi:MAG: pyruvate dehydrogenase (acetyl-transferring), homodimeric type, partial [Ketobacteraceae bacterium]|nr:pyruvate dehydrogenase (acetyl-transferring), homodimeric type [Ketobacteraceae bacterium]